MTATAHPRVPARTAVPAPTAAGLRARKAARRRRLTACGVLMTPFFALLITVFLIPVGTAVYLSFFSDDQPGLGFGPERTVFVGLRSYAAVLTDPTFLGGLGTVALYCLIYIPLMVVGALALALLLDSGVVRLRAFAQLGLFLPHAVPGIIAALIWLYLYTPGISPVIDLLGRADLTVDFLGVHTVIPSIVNIALWSNLGYNMVVFYAALQAVPREVIEASVVDGAGPVRTALQVKTPLVRASIVMVAIFTLIWALQLFTEPMLLSQSSPMINSRFSPSMYIYDAAFNRNNYSLAAAASVVLLACTVALSYGVTRFTSRADTAEEAR
jgi:multiple sugar transport system permease protein